MTIAAGVPAPARPRRPVSAATSPSSPIPGPHKVVAASGQPACTWWLPILVPWCAALACDVADRQPGPRPAPETMPVRLPVSLPVPRSRAALRSARPQRATGGDDGEERVMRSGRRLSRSLPHILTARRGRGHGAAVALSRRRRGASRWSLRRKTALAVRPVTMVAVAVLLGGCASSASGNAGNQGNQADPAGVLRLGDMLELADPPALARLPMGFFGTAPGRGTLGPVPVTANAAQLAAREQR